MLNVLISLFAGVSAFVVAGSTWAAEIPVDLYGRINISMDNADPGDDDWESNASRLGLKGSYDLSDGLSVIYQLEQEVDYAHGGTDVDTLFKTRNTYLGLKGAFGKVFFGTHDTPFKRAQAKIDLFNDQVGDIKNLVAGEVRARDSWVYHSPKLGEGFSVQAMYVPSDGALGSSKSLSLGWSQGDVHLGVAVDMDMRKNDRSVSRTRVYDSWRGVAQYTPGAWKLGALVQSSEQTNAAGADRETAWIASLGYTINRLTLQGQYGASDILRSDAEHLLLGVTYKLTSSAKLYFYASDLESGGNVDSFSTGVEYKF